MNSDFQPVGRTTIRNHQMPAGNRPTYHERRGRPPAPAKIAYGVMTDGWYVQPRTEYKHRTPQSACTWRGSKMDALRNLISAIFYSLSCPPLQSLHFSSQAHRRAISKTEFLGPAWDTAIHSSALYGILAWKQRFLVRRDR